MDELAHALMSQQEIRFQRTLEIAKEYLCSKNGFWTRDPTTLLLISYRSLDKGATRAGKTIGIFG